MNMVSARITATSGFASNVRRILRMSDARASEDKKALSSGRFGSRWLNWNSRRLRLWTTRIRPIGAVLLPRHPDGSDRFPAMRCAFAGRAKRIRQHMRKGRAWGRECSECGRSRSFAYRMRVRVS